MIGRAPQAGKSNESAQVAKQVKLMIKRPGACNLARGTALRALPGHWRQTRNVSLPFYTPYLTQQVAETPMNE